MSFDVAGLRVEPIVRQFKEVEGAFRFYEESNLVAKTCTACSHVKCVDEFYQASRGDGFKPTCIKCQKRANAGDPRNRERNKEYYRENAERLRAYRRTYYKENRESIIENRRLNPEYYREIARRSYHKDVEMSREKARARYRKNGSRRIEQRRLRTDLEIEADRLRLHPSGEKRCRRCGEMKSLSEFNGGITQHDALQSCCKGCDLISREERRVKAKSSYWQSVGIPIECYMCGGPYEDVEHVWSQSSGGPDVPQNTLPSCAACNRGPGGKHTQMLLTYLWKRYGATEASAILRKVVGWGVWPFDQPYVAEDWA